MKKRASSKVREFQNTLNALLKNKKIIKASAGSPSELILILDDGSEIIIEAAVFSKKLQIKFGHPFLVLTVRNSETNQQKTKTRKVKGAAK